MISADRRAQANEVLSRVTRQRKFQRLTTDAKLLYVVGLLVADDAGIIHKLDGTIPAALADPEVMTVARSLAAEWGLL